MEEIFSSTTACQQNHKSGARQCATSPVADWRFNSADIFSWAHFSGDYNPVHFSVESARLAGSSEVIVHGMLPLVYVKQAIASTFEFVHFQQNWLKISCRFRLPMKRDKSHDLTIAPDRTFALHATDEQNVAVLQGTFGLHRDLTSTTAVENIDILPDEARERLSQFSRSFSKVNPFWIAIDSLAFSRLIANVISLPISLQRQLTEGVSTGGELLKRAIALQTTHTIIVSPWLLLHQYGDGDFKDTVRIGLGVPHVVRDTPAMLVGSQPADVFIGGRFAMRCEIGFLLRRRVSL